jgi:zinc/manganese transport system permease protein
VSIDWSFLAPPFVAGLLVLATHVPLGTEVLRRGIIFIDLAIAQVATLGVIIVGLVGWGEAGWPAQIAAGAAALLGALLLAGIEKRWLDIQEALIGLLFVTAAAVGILLLANNPHGGEHLKDLLAGQILWVLWPQVAELAGLTVILLVLWFSLGRRLGNIGFYGIFALAVMTSVQLVGVLLVFASLIAPAVALRNGGRWRLLAAWSLGALGYGGGLLLSAIFDLPTGAIIVCCLVSVAVLSLALPTVGKSRHLR